ncbi:protein tyrosine phosphatase [Stenotrophomonas maltophilia]|nr:protein tyrosine phosphatase [Stenotrophomonas maltophilia]
MTGAWARDLNTDIAAILRWNASHLVSLLEPWEFSELRIEDLPAVAKAMGLKWHGMPITDGEAPDRRLLLQWPALSAALVREMESGCRVVVHCKGGLGRAGTVAAMLLLQSGASRTAENAINMIRRVRPGAIETAAQEKFLARWEEELHRPVIGTDQPAAQS